MARRVAFALIVAAASACAPRARTPARPATPGLVLEFAGASIVARPGAGDPLRPARFGGISGITFDPVTGELLGVSDDPVDSRVFIFTVSKPDEPFVVRLKAYFPLPPGPAAAAALDPEGIAMTADGRLFVASEGFGDRQPRIPPGILEYSRRVEYVGQLTLPARFVPPAEGALTRGVRHNTGYESLTLAPGGGRLFTATESALAQDGEPATVDRGAVGRILELVADGRGFVPRREFAYPVDPLEKPAFAPGFFVCGLVELVALDDSTFLAMERSYAEERPGGRSQYRIRIYQVSLEGATDISSVESLRGARGVKPVRKTRLLDFADVRGLPPELAGLDNFEGMALGPVLPDGSRTLLVVSDDNFNATQRTAFLRFRLRPPASGRDTPRGHGVQSGYNQRIGR